MADETGSGDECYVETRNGFITKITKDRHRVCNVEGEMIGALKISFEVFRRMVDLYERSTNPYLNYEYVLMDVTDTVERPVIRFQNLIWGDVDTKDDFKRLQNGIYRKLMRKENPFDRENLLSYISQIFPDDDAASAEILQIGGMSNKNFKVNMNGAEYVLRVPGNGSEGMVDRANEEFNAIKACKLGVNPVIRYFNPVTGIKLADFIHNAETLNPATIQRHDNMKKVARIYKTVHHSQVRLKNEFNIFQEIEKYERLLENVNASMYDGWETVREQVMSIEGYLNELGVELCACHNDAVPENFIKAEDGTLYLIDWEYSGVNDPMADIAALFLESNFSEENQDYLLRCYYEDEIPHNARAKIKCYEILWDSLWALWTVIKEACGDDFGTYGIDRYNRAVENLKCISDNLNLN
jgi:thiamine kinase-like enzyme